MPVGDLKAITREVLEPIWGRHQVPTRKIAERLGVTPQALHWKARRLGLPPRTHVRSWRLDHATFRDMWLAGVSTTDIAKAFGYSHPSSIGRRADVLGLSRRTRSAGRKGTRSGWNETISLVEFYERRLGEAMAREAEEARK